MSIYNKLNKIQAELKCNKSQFNSFGKYSYRNCEDILEALKPLLIKNTCVLKISDELVLVGERYYIKATATIIDTETAEREDAIAYAREEENKKGMDSSQLTGSTSSYARKYALNGLFMIDDNKDADSQNNEVNKVKKTSELSDAQIKRLYAIGKSKNKTVEDIKKVIAKDFNKTSITELTKSEYDTICNRLESLA